MLAKLKKLIREKGLAQVTNELGYRSQSTINHWLKKGKVPVSAESKVKTYLSK